MKIEQRFADMPVKALADPRTRGILLDWRDELAIASKRQADYAWVVLSKILSVAKDRGRITVNPCERGGRVYHGTRVDLVWSEDDEAAFSRRRLAPASPAGHGAMDGQRQGDLLRLTWSAYDGESIRLKQSKTSERVTVLVGAPLKAILEATPRRSPIILVNSEGRPWTPDGFRATSSRRATRPGIKGLTFNDLRGTAVTRLALVGCTEAQIAAVTGHSLSDVQLDPRRPLPASRSGSGARRDSPARDEIRREQGLLSSDAPRKRRVRVRAGASGPCH